MRDNGHAEESRLSSPATPPDCGSASGGSVRFQQVEQGLAPKLSNMFGNKNKMAGAFAPAIAASR
jgi:hypothetical protein